MLNKNNIAIGILAGLILPALTWLVFGYALKNNAALFNKPAIPYLVSIALNLFIIKYLYKKGLDNTGTGMILCTFVCMALVFLFKIGYLK
jgi:hypothetical protein